MDGWMMQMSRNAFLPVCSRRSSSFSSELAGRSHGRGGRSRSGGMFGGTTKALSPVDPAPVPRPFASLLGVCVCLCARTDALSLSLFIVTRERARTRDRAPLL